jgi:hypothetical protein
MESGPTLFDNSKAGKFTPITLGRLRSAWRSEGVDYIQVLLEKLSSAVDLQGELSQAPEDLQGRKSRRRAIGPRNNGPAGNRANELRKVGV